MEANTSTWSDDPEKRPAQYNTDDANANASMRARCEMHALSGCFFPRERANDEIKANFRTNQSKLQDKAEQTSGQIKANFRTSNGMRLAGIQDLTR